MQASTAMRMDLYRCICFPVGVGHTHMYTDAQLLSLQKQPHTMKMAVTL